MEGGEEFMPSKILELVMLYGAVPAPFVVTWVLYKCTGPLDIHVVAGIMCLPLFMVLLAGKIYFSRQEYLRNKHRH